MTLSDAPRFLIAAGGTGGHVFPGLAVARALLEAEPSSKIVFSGTSSGFEKTKIPEAGFTLETLDVRGLKGMDPKKTVHHVWIAAKAVLGAGSIVEKHKPHVLISIGGYAAGPIALSSRIKGVKLAIVEPNSVSGFTHRLLARLADRAYLHWDLARATFAPGIVKMTGVPIRPEFRPVPYSLKKDEKKRILILGGSLGARSINHILPAVLAKFSREKMDLDILHQTGKNDERDVKKKYEELGLTKAEVFSFIEDPAKEIAKAHLVVARAGASTLAEISAVGRPMVLIPFPYAADDHQNCNARALFERGAALYVAQTELDSPALFLKLSSLLEDDERLTKMAEASSHFGRPDAAKVMARDLIDLAGE